MRLSALAFLVVGLLVSSTAEAQRSKGKKKTRPAPAPVVAPVPADAPAIDAPALADLTPDDDLSIEPLVDLEPAIEPIELAPIAPPSPQTGAKPSSWQRSPRLFITPMAGFGSTSEGGNASTPVFGMALGLEYGFHRELSIGLTLRDHSYSRSYLTTRSDLGSGGPARLDVNEQKIAADLLLAWELPRLFGIEDQRWSLSALTGPSARFFLNEAVPSQYAAMAIGGRMGFAPSESLDVSASGTWGYNLLDNPDLLSVHGAPLAVSTFGAGVGLRLAPGTRFRIGYEGEVVTMAASYRLFHTLSFFFDISR